MLQWFPPRTLAVIAFAFSALLSCSRAPAFARPQQTFAYENVAGANHELNEEQSIERVNSENAHTYERRSPTEDADNPVGYFPARKRHGIETPIRPLQTESDGTSKLNEGKMASLRSKVDQPERSNSVPSSMSDKTDKTVSLSNSENQNKVSESILGATEGRSSLVNKPSQDTEQTTERKSDGLDEKGDQDKNKENTQAAQDQHKTESDSQTQTNDQNNDNTGDVNNNNVAGKGATTGNSITSEERGKIPSDKVSVDTSPKDAEKVNTPESTDNQGTSSKLAVSSEGSNSAQATSDNDGGQTAPEPIRDKLGTSGSEIVTTTRGPYEARSHDYTESKRESSGPEVGHFQVDDKSADLEINANSAGVKVKAKPASLQVVSRPGSHSASSDVPLARSFYQHYHYPPFHRFNHWLPGFRRGYKPLRRHHLFRPHRFYPRDWFPAGRKNDYDPDYADGGLYRRRAWYPHHRHSRYHEPYLHERSRMEAPIRRSRYQYDEPWSQRYRRRFRGGRFHRTRSPLRRHLYIPVMNNFAAPIMNVAPEQPLPLNPQMTEQMIPQVQRQNIVTPVPPPINLIGNPPPSIMNGANLGMNEMTNFGTMGSVNGLGATNGYSGIVGLNGPNGLKRMDENSLDSMAGLNGEMGEYMANIEGAQGTRQHFGTSVPETDGRPVKKAAIQPVKPTKDLKNKNGQRHSVRGHHRVLSSRKGKLDLKGWEQIVKHHHDIKSRDKMHHRSRRTVKLTKHNIAHLHAQNPKDEKGDRKNAIIIHRPPIVYHPPPEIYHRPAIVVHRAPIMLHRSPIIYHQPPVVVHRPAIIYHQPPIVFHQPPPVVNQPIMHSHDAYVTKPVVYQTNSVVSNAHTYYGVPSNVYSGTFGCHGAHCAFRKEDVPRTGNKPASTEAKATKAVKKEKRNIYGPFDFIASSEGAREQLTYISKEEGRSKRDSLFVYYSFLRHKRQARSTQVSEKEIPRKKKKDVVVNRPPIIYHPPPEIYHRPDIVVHRPPLVIHRPPIIYHQPPVIVHRPAVVYHQPPIVFHQPPPAVSQPLLYSHDSFAVHPTVYASHQGSVVRDSGHYVGMPNVISNYGHPLFGMPHFPMGKRKRSLEVGKQNLANHITTNGDSKAKPSSAKQKRLGNIRHQPKNETSERAGKKNSVVIARPPIIYHPPPEVYHRPIIVVHRAPIMLHRAPIVYHQPPVVVHRPAIVYHQAPLVFHQPPPVVNQPILKSHDTWIRRPVIVPYTSSISQHSTYVGVPDSFSAHMFGHYQGHVGHGHAFYKSKVARTSQPVEEQAIPKNKIEKKSTSSTSEKHYKNVKHFLKRKKSNNEKGGKKNAVIVKRPPVIYHPPPEIYHRPDIIIHRAPIMIHRAAIIYHQPPVIVHRPAVVYHQPPLIFQQPPPVVHQPLMISHDTWVPKPTVTLYSSRIHHTGHMYQIPQSYYYHGLGAVHHLAYGKSKVPPKSKLTEENSDLGGMIKKRKQYHRKQDKDKSNMEQHHTGRKKHATLTLSKVETETGAKLHSAVKSHLKHHAYFFHKEKEKTESGSKKNAVIIHRPPIIYHPPPEVYHRPNIVVHRAPIVLYRAPIIYHQPPVVVHRPAIVYHQSPIVFHQPPPTVHQPILHSHDTWLTKTVAVPYSTHVHHALTYHGVPHEEIYMHGLGSGAFVKSHVPPKNSRREKIQKHKSKNSKPSDGTHESRGKPSTVSGIHGRVRRSSDTVRTIMNPWMPLSEVSVSPAEDTRPMGARHRILRALDDLKSKPEGERAGFITKSNVGKDEMLAEPRRFKKGRDLETSKRTILIIRRPPIIYHPPSHVIHRPSIVVHRQPLVVHRQPLLFHRPPILIRRPPIIIHRPPILFRRPPLLVHRPSLMIHRHPFIIHRAPFIIHHHPIMIHRPPIIIHKSPNFLVHHSSAIHHYPMHMVHVHCPGCGFGKSSILRVGYGTTTESPKARTRKKDKPRSHPHPNSSTISKFSYVSLTARPTSQLSNSPKPFVSDHDDESAAIKLSKRKVLPRHKKKKDVVVNRPPIIYHPPPEVYHRPDIVVHRAPILIHRPPIVYHQPPVVVHRPAVVYHQPPIVFHQPSPAVNQPVLYSHDSFQVHPMAFASHMGSVMNDAGHYVGLPHGGISNYPEPLRGPIPSALSPGLSRRGKVEKPKDYPKSLPRNSSKAKGKQANGEKKNKVIVARPPMIYHPPPEIYDRPNVVVHRPDLVFHRPAIVYHQPSVVIHRPPVVYRQPPVVFHQPAPTTSQPIIQSMDTYTPQPLFAPRATQMQQSSMYSFPGYNNYGWQMNGNMLGWHGQSASGWGYAPAVGRSKVEGVTKKNKKGRKTNKSYGKGVIGMTRGTPSATNHNRRSNEHHHHHHHHQKHRHHDRNPDEKEIFGQKSTINHRGHHRSHVVIINRPPLVYQTPTQVVHPPPVLMALPPVVYHPPLLVFHQPPTIVHHPAIVYHQSAVVFHNPPPITDSQMLHPPMQSAYLPVSPHAHSASMQYEYTQNDYSPVVSGPVFSKSNVPKAAKMKAVKDTHTIGQNKRNLKSQKSQRGHDIIGSKRQYMDLVVNRPPVVFHSPPDIFEKPPVVIPQAPIIVNRPPVLYHPPPFFVHKPPIIYHQAPLVLRHHTPRFHHHHWHHYHAIGLGYGKSSVPGKRNSSKKKHPAPAPFASPYHHVGTYIRDPSVYVDGPWNKAFLKSSLAKTGNEKEKSSVFTSSKRNKDRSRRSTSTHTSRHFSASSEADSTKKLNKKNKVVIMRPPMIYHPPPEIYEKPDIIVHRPDYVVHQPSIVYHQASVVVHRPPVVYQQPQVVFHQPPAMVHQPIMNSHDTYVAHPVQVPYASQIQHIASYGRPNLFTGGWNFGWGGSPNFAYGKSVVPKIPRENGSHANARGKHAKRDTRLHKAKNKQDKGHKKDRVIMHRPPLIYHPPPEIYHRPSIVGHRPDLVIHRPSVVFHQPSVVVHRPPVIYHQPSIVFHQPSPMVNQPMIHAHDTYRAHPDFVPYWSHGYHSSTYVGAPHSFSGEWGWGYGHGNDIGVGYPFGKSKVEKAVGHRENTKQNKNTSARSRNKRNFVLKQRSPKHPKSHAALRKETIKGRPGHKKNLVIMHRPPVIYHPPPEIYHRPTVVVHRPDLVIHRPSIVFHQPSVVVHRPVVVYHQSPIVFHQPPPMVHQPLLHSHETYMAHPFFPPFLSYLQHAGTYVGAPNAFHGGWGWGHAFGKSKVAKASTKSVDIRKKDREIRRNQRSTKELKTKNLHKTVAPEEPRSTEQLPQKNRAHLLKKKQDEHLKDSTKHERNVIRKDLVIIRRPEMIYHLPTEIYDRPDIIVHRPDLVYHQPSIVYRQPSVVVNRPPITYNQPPVVFHQPPPMIDEPVNQQQDQYYARPFFDPYMDWNPGSGWRPWNGMNDWGLGTWNNLNGNRWPFVFGPAQNPFGPAFVKSITTNRAPTTKASKRMISSKGSIKHKQWQRHHQQLHNTSNAFIDSVAKTMTTSQKAAAHTALRKKITGGKQGHKKNMVVMRRPAMVYHPPAEVYHRPDIIVHRPDIVIHRPSVVFHQSSVVVHRPPVVYHQPTVIFHQPPPMVQQPILHSHETYMAHPMFEPFASNLHHAGSYVGAPHFFHGEWGHGFGHAFGKSHVQRTEQNIKGKRNHKKNEITGQRKSHPERRKSAKKNAIVVSRPPIIYHPPPEIYHRPDIVVHRAPIVLHRPPIVYHQPPVVVHRPAVVYHQPPIIFDQPPPVIHQPILHSHDSFVVHPETEFVPEGSTVSHAIDYVGIPSSVMPQNEFASHFHRSHIEHRKASGREGTEVPESKIAIKSAISRNPITHKENTGTAITDEAQKKTLRSHIGKAEKESKQRNAINTHSSFTPVTPFNDVHPAGTTIEHQKLSNIPGSDHDRQQDVAKRSTGARRKKRQAFIPEVESVGYHSILPAMYKYALAGLQNQGTEAIEHLPEDTVTHPAASPSYPNAAFLQSSLVSPYAPVPAKEHSPEVHVHVETAKSSIPLGRTKRQLMPVYPVPRLLGSPAHLLYSGIQPAQPEISNSVSPYQVMQMPAYNPYPSANEHRPRVSISVNSGRSRVPVAKRHVIQRTKRQLWGVRSPFPAMFPLSPSHSFFPRSPYTLMLASLYQAGALPSYAAGYGLNQSPYDAHRTLIPDERNVGYNALLNYLNALYGTYSGYPPKYNHQRPNVRVDVHTSRSKIQKVKTKSSNSTSTASRSRLPSLLHKRHSSDTERSKRQLHSYRSLSPLSNEHKAPPTKEKRPMKRRPRRGSHFSHNNKRDTLQDNTLIRNGEGESQAQDDQAPEQSLQGQFVGGNSNAAMFNADASVNDRNKALSQLNNMALEDQGAITQQESAVPDENRWQMPQGPGLFPANRLPLQSLMNNVPVNYIPFTSPMAPYTAQGQQFQVMRAPFLMPPPSFQTGIVPMQVSPTVQMPELSPYESEQHPAHTSVSVDVAKSSVPNKKKKSHHANFTVYKKRVRNAKRQKITLLNRLSAMQIFPQTFKQNGVNMPSFNTIPINNYISENERLTKELQSKHGQSKRKHRIPGVKKTIISTKRHYKTSRQPGINKKDKIQTRNEKTKAVHRGKRSHHHPHQSGASLNKDKPKKHQNKANDNSHKTGDKRQFYPTVTEPARLLLPAGIDLPVLGVPQISQHPHVSVRVEVSKRTSNASKRNRNDHGVLRRQFTNPDQGLAPRNVQEAMENNLEKGTANEQVFPVLQNAQQQGENNQAFEGRPFQRVISKRQMFGTVPLLSPVTQLMSVHDKVQQQSRARSTNNESNQIYHKTKRQLTPTNIKADGQTIPNTDGKFGKFSKRRFIDYLAGQARLSPQLPARENTHKVKRQLALMQFGGALERRGSPKQLGAILKKPTGNGRFLLNPNFNKPVEVFATNPNIPVVPQQKLKFREPSIMEDQMPFEAAAPSNKLPIQAEMSPNQMFRSPPYAVPFRQEHLEIGGLPKTLSAGIAEPMIPPSPPAVKFIGTDSEDAGTLPRGGLSQINPLFLFPRVVPSPLLLGPTSLLEHPQGTESLHLPLETPPVPLLSPPLVPFPPPEMPDFHPQQLGETADAAGQDTDEERPSVHVNVEMSKSHIPNRGRYWKHKTSHTTSE